MSKKSSKKPRNILKPIKSFFKPLKTEQQYPRLERPMTGISPGAQSIYDSILDSRVGISDTQHRANIENIELARLEQERETANNNLMSQHKVMLVTVAATFIALFSSGVAIFVALQKEIPPAPIVNVTPAQQAPADINVYVPQQPTNSPPEGQ